MTAVSWYDIVMAAFLIFALVRGAMKGIVWQLAAIASIALCFYFSGTLSATLAPMIPVEAPANRWVAMFLLYVGFSFLSFGAARVLHNAIEKLKIQALDRHLGAIFGLVKGVAFCLVVTFFVATYSDEMRQVVLKSKSGYGAAIVMDRLHPVMPEKLHEIVEPYIHSLDQPGMDLRYTEHTVGTVEGETPSLGDKGAFGGPDDNAPIGNIDPPSPDAMYKANPANPDDAATALLQEISAAYSGEPQSQTKMAEQIELSLMGLPQSVSLKVLQDWQHDLNPSKSADPDPKTDQATSLDARIVRQLELNRIPLSTLKQSLRDRLGSALR